MPQRVYPYGNLASGVIGYIGRPSQTDIDNGASSTDILGKAGLEKQYDSQLQGTEGAIKYQVDAQRTVLSVLGEEFPKAGNKLVTEIDVDLQQVLEQALIDGLDLARTKYNPNGCDPGSAQRRHRGQGMPGARRWSGAGDQHRSDSGNGFCPQLRSRPVCQLRRR